MLQEYLDGDLTPEEEKEALHMIADDPELRSMLRFEQKLSDFFATESISGSQTAVPKGFTDQVMQSIEQREQQEEKFGLLEKIKLWSQNLWTPRTVQWRPAYAFVFALILLVSLSYPLYVTQSGDGFETQDIEQAQNMNRSVQQVSAETGEVMLRFVYIDEKANSVAVAGDFTNWKPVELTRQNVNGKTVWTGMVSMSRGEHNYMFVKNGNKWVTDPLAPVQRDDGFGNKNAVIYI